MTEASPAVRHDPPTVMLLGLGELRRELVMAFQRLGVVVVVAGPDADAGDRRIADRTVAVDLADAGALTALVERERPDVVVAAAYPETSETVIATDALAAIAERGIADVVPTPRSLGLSLDPEGLRRLVADELGLPTVPFWFVGSADELAAVVQHAGFPLVVRPVAAARGEGESVLLRPDDVQPGWDRAAAACRDTARALVESVVDFDYEVTLLAVRGEAHGVQFCQPIGHRHIDNDTLESWQPLQMTPDALGAARSIAGRLVKALGGRGVFAVELLVKGDEVYFADISPHPCDSGLVTLRSQRLSEFELHARALLGLPLDTIMVSPGAAVVVYAGQADKHDSAEEAGRPLVEALSGALAVPESDLRVFGPPGLCRGVALATAPDVTIARERVRHVGTALRKQW